MPTAPAARGWNKIFVTIRPGKDPAAGRKGGVRRDRPNYKPRRWTDWELEKIRHNAHRAQIQSGAEHFGPCRGTGRRSHQFRRSQPRQIHLSRRWRRSPKADIQRVARQYLTEENRTVIVTMPKKAAAPAQPKQ